MEAIREIKTYGDDVLKKFSGPIYDLAYPIARLALYDFKGNRYMITKITCEDGEEYESFLLSYEDKGDLNIVSLINNKEFYQLETMGKIYVFKPGDVTIVDKEEDKVSELLAYNEDIEGVDFKSFLCKQVNNPKHKRVMSVYRVDEYPDPNMVLNYLDSRRPTFYEFTVGGKIICAKKQYLLNKDNYYNPCVQIDGEMKRINYKKAFDDEDLKIMVQKTGFESNVPRELIELYKDKNDQMNDIKSITKEYIKSI